MKRKFTAFRFSDTDKNTVVTTRTVRPPWMRRVIIGEAVAIVALSFAILARYNFETRQQETINTLLAHPATVVSHEPVLVMPKPAIINWCYKGSDVWTPCTFIKSSVAPRKRHAHKPRLDICSMSEWNCNEYGVPAYWIHPIHLSKQEGGLD